MKVVTQTTAIPREGLFIPKALGDVSVKYNGHEFSVLSSRGIESPIENWNLSKELRGISPENLEKVLSVGHLALNKIGEDYVLRFKGELKGGGLLGAALVYVGTNIVGGAMVIGGMVTGNPVLVAAGVTTVTAAPGTLIYTLPAPTP